jgi:hypothetical protein
MLMIHIAFNFQDYLVQLRLIALIASIILVTCLGIAEFGTNVRIRERVILSTVMILLGLVVAYALVLLGKS